MNSVAIKSKCAYMRNGIEIWIPEGEKLEKFQAILSNLKAHLFVEWEGRNMNTADLVGIFEPQDMEDMKRRKNGEWVCAKGTWHKKFQDCDCRAYVPDFVPPPDDRTPEEIERNNIALAKIREGMKNIGSG